MILFHHSEGKDRVDGEGLPLVHAEGADHILAAAVLLHMQAFPGGPHLAGGGQG